MGNELTVFQNEEFGSVRTINRNGEPWFVANDVCKALQIGNSRDAINRLDNDEKGVVITDTLGGNQKINIINEAGLYSLILTSRKPEAKEFKRWITHEVIPAIRKTGSYSVEHKKEITIDLDALKVIVGTSVAETVTQLLPLIQNTSVEKPIRKRNVSEDRQFQDVVKSVMKTKRLSLAKMAKKLGVCNATVHNWKNGICEPTGKNYTNFIQVFNLGSSDLKVGIF